ncbi:MAG: hypothetical protein OXL33_05860 [Chloroflexota bacterium]|nr:hypothetical protein [Chloroflexota bacterium]
MLEKYDYNASTLKDRTTLIIAGAALSVSLTFIRDLPGATDLLYLLAIAWFALAFSVFAMLWSIGQGRSAMRKMIRQIDERETELDGEPYSSRTERLNKSATVSLVVGVGLVLLFVTCNLPW